MAARRGFAGVCRTYLAQGSFLLAKNELGEQPADVARGPAALLLSQMTGRAPPEAGGDDVALATQRSLDDAPAPPPSPGEKAKKASMFSRVASVGNRAGKESEIPNFKGSYLGRFPLVSADSWTSDHLSERS